MAFKIDFDKLRIMTHEDRERMDAEQRGREIYADEQRRSERSKHCLVVVLQSDPEIRATIFGALVMQIRGHAEDGRLVTGVYFTPEHLNDDDRWDRVGKLNAGDVVKLDGFWKMREWKDPENQPRSSWEFQIQRFELKDPGVGRALGLKAQMVARQYGSHMMDGR